MQAIKTVANDLALIGHPLTEDEIVHHVLRDLTFEFKEISVGIRARSEAISFEELYEKLSDHEMFLKLDDAHKDSHQFTAQYSQRSSSNSSGRRTLPQANYTASETNNNTNWIMDSGASHHITSDLQNMAIHSDYVGNDGIIIGDGSGILITHTGSTTLSSCNSTFQLNNVLCAPSIKKNLISVSQFCKQNNTSIEFFPNNFVVKDLSTGASLAKGRSNGNVYEWQQSSSQLFLSTKGSLNQWHRRLGHPSNRILHQITSHHSLKISKSPISNCNSCLCNKSHRLPFGPNTLSSSRPLELIYSDVWGPAPILGFAQSRYYVIFVDHYTKYTWLYLLKLKSEVPLIFTRFKNLVENYFQTKILTLYTDGGTEYNGVHTTALNLGIQHMTSPPYTPEIVGTAKRRHRHIVETGLTLLHQASIPLSFWPTAFLTAIYLINRFPTPLLSHISPFEKLFSISPNYTKLRVFGCLCYPWLKPYTKHKLQPRSKPCIFLGYSIAHNAYKCFDPDTAKFFISRHVLFVEDKFPGIINQGTSFSLTESVLNRWHLDSPTSTPPSHPQTSGILGACPSSLEAPITHLKSPPSSCPRPYVSKTRGLTRSFLSSITLQELPGIVHTTLRHLLLRLVRVLHLCRIPP
ncbi:hypothetical protein Pint_22927 [Pistacia integerrima]|uniref:Uncharacterized protein n=1 Tax=Pistacia integerrima TaxID=434235 RepID=A0ACC0YNM1_9ROSI|nr:hypothetical protein Pint_22927 [Pistacia integerrima]